MLVKALGAFAVLLSGMGVAHAQDFASAPIKPIDFTVQPTADQAYAPLSGMDQAPDPFSPSVWRTGQVDLSNPNGVSDQRLQLSVGEHYWSPDGMPLASPDRGIAGPDRSFAIDYSFGIPGALSFSTPGHDWDLTPHAGFGVSSNGGKASAGAVLNIRQRAQNALEDIGVHDGTPMAARGRYYLFAAASGRAVGLNLLRDSTTGDWRRAGWTTDPSSDLVGEAQIGVGWRRGPMQTSIGYVHRDYDTPLATKGGMDGRNDDMVAFSFAIRPH